MPEIDYFWLAMGLGIGFSLGVLVAAVGEMSHERRLLVERNQELRRDVIGLGQMLDELERQPAPAREEAHDAQL